MQQKKTIEEVWYGGDLSFWDRNSKQEGTTITTKWFKSSKEFDDMLRTEFED